MFPGSWCRQSVAPVRALNAAMVPSHDVAKTRPPLTAGEPYAQSGRVCVQAIAPFDASNE